MALTSGFLGRMLEEGRSANGELQYIYVSCLYSKRWLNGIRHAMLVDQLTGDVTVPLNAALQSEGRLELANSQ